MKQFKTLMSVCLILMISVGAPLVEAKSYGSKSYSSKSYSSSYSSSSKSKSYSSSNKVSAPKAVKASNSTSSWSRPKATVATPAVLKAAPANKVSAPKAPQTGKTATTGVVKAPNLSSTTKAKVATGVVAGTAAAGATASLASTTPADPSATGSKAIVTPTQKPSLPVGQVKPLNAAEKAQARATSLQASKAKEEAIKAARESKIFATTTSGKSYKQPEIRSTRKAYYRDHYDYYDRPQYSSYRNRFEDRSYGGFDGGWLSTMLMAEAMGKEGGDAMMWYALTGSPMLSMFLADAKDEAKHSGDKELLKRIEAIELENAKLKAQGVQPQAIDQVMAAKNVPAEVMFASDVLTNGADSEMTVFTGGKGGLYEKLCAGDQKANFRGLKDIASNYGVDVSCQNSEGGLENLRKAAVGEAKAFPVQADGLFKFKQSHPGFGNNEYVMYQEPFLMLTGKKSNIDELSDIDEDSVIFVVGGAKASWNIMTEFAAGDTFMGFGGNKDYAKAKVVPTNDWDKAISAVKNNPNAVLFTVMSVDADRIQSIDKTHGKDLKLVTVDDNRFLSIDDNGSRVYAECSIAGNALPNLQAGSFWGASDTTTLCTDALFVVDQDWVSSQSDRTRKLVGLMLTEMLEELPSINQQLN